MEVVNNIIKETRTKFDKVVVFFEKDISTIRTGRATPSLVENITVDSYGVKMPLKQVASISVPSPRMLLIQPWDRSTIPSIEKAVLQSDLGVSPVTDNGSIRVSLPSLTEEYRKSLTKILNEKGEEARVSLRKAREEAWKDIQDSFKEGTVREDDKFKGKDDLQKVVDEYNKKIEEVTDRKKREILEF
ncbi:MAG: ribosome recycling factor [Candidatus Nealsonbacteria bacterium]|nr:ribosome recycling factor [Candidatus Nealsonbacteria bacterium]